MGVANLYLTSFDRQTEFLSMRFLDPHGRQKVLSCRRMTDNASRDYGGRQKEILFQSIGCPKSLMDDACECGEHDDIPNHHYIVLPCSMFHTTAFKGTGHFW